MPDRLLIRGGLLMDPSQRLEGKRDLLIEAGRVKAVLKPGERRAGNSRLAASEILDAEGLWVVPGLIDMHVHLREPGGRSETIASGSAAAAAGGFTAVLAMANTEPPMDDPELLERLKAVSAREAKVHVFFAAAATQNLRGERLSDIRRLARAGAAAFSDDGRPVMNADLMRRALENAKGAGRVVISHCEDLNLGDGALFHRGSRALEKRIPGAPWAAETVMVLRDIALAELTGGRVHIAHISAAQSVEAVRRAKDKGIGVTAEATPHHFTLSADDIPGPDPNFKMNPPLRDAEDVQAVREGLKDGTIDAIASDHAPHERSKKAAGISRAPFGIIGLETSLGLALTRLVHEKIISPARLVELMSAAPARILGLKNKGTLKIGSKADITLIAPNESWRVQAPFISKSSNSPFVGMSLKGRSAAAIVGGRVVFRREPRG